MPKLSNKEKWEVVGFLMETLNIEQDSALSMYNGIPQKKRSKLLEEIRSGKAKKNI